MTTAQRLAIRLSEIRQNLNTLSANDNLTDEQRSEMDTLTTEYADSETRWRAAVVAEDTAPAEDGQPAELRALQSRSRLNNFMSAAARCRDVTGADAEFRAAQFGDADREGLVPWALLDTGPRVEARADALSAAPADVGTSQNAILGRVFANTAAAYLGVMMPSVAVGEQLYPVLTTGADPAQKAKGATQDATEASFTTTTLEPRRLTARYKFSVEDAARFAGMEEALRRDLAGAFGEQMDKQVLTGDGTAPNVNGLFNTLTDPAAPSEVSGFADYIKTAAAGVDGRYASMLGQIKTLVGAKTYGHASSVFATGSDTAAAVYLANNGGGFQASSLIAAPDANIQQAILYKGGDAGAAVAPIWDGFELIRDPYTDAKKGQISLTAIALWNFALIRKDAYAQVAFKLA